MKEFIADKPQRLKEYTDNTYAQGSFFWNYLIKNREIRVNGKKVGEDILLSAGDKVAYYLPPAKEKKPAFYIVYEDDNVLVADKESGVNSEAVFAALKRERECFFLHRLDRNTSGLLVFALKEGAEKELLAAFKERRIEKRYCALCFGKFGKEEGILTAYLKKDENKSLVRIYDAPTFGAEKIVTEYRAGERCGEFTKTEILLHTGKTHQIRAHLAHIGCPVAGDTKYGDKEKNRKYNLTRQCLIAKSLKFSLLGKLAYLNDLKFVSRFELKIPCLPT